MLYVLVVSAKKPGGLLSTYCNKKKPLRGVTDKYISILLGQNSRGGDVQNISFNRNETNSLKNKIINFYHFVF